MYSKFTPICPRPIVPDGDSFADPYGWTDVCTEGTNPATISLVSSGYFAAPKYYAVSLTASTEYTFKGVNSTEGQPNARIDLYDAAGTKVAYNSGSWDAEWTVYTVSDLVYTPATTGIYVFNLQSGSDMGMSEYLTYGVSVSPRPATLSKVGPTPYETSAGRVSAGCRKYEAVASNAGVTKFDLWQLLAPFASWDAFMDWLRIRWNQWWWFYSGALIIAPLEDQSTPDMLGNTISHSAYPDTLKDWDVPFPGSESYGLGSKFSITSPKSLAGRDWEISFYFFLHFWVDPETGELRSDYSAPIMGPRGNYEAFKFEYEIPKGETVRIKCFSFFGGPRIGATDWTNDTWRTVKFTKTGDTLATYIYNPAGGGTIYSGTMEYTSAMDNRISFTFNDYVANQYYSTRVKGLSVILL